MPVRFRCPLCRSKLSIATRKIGTTVACPKCYRSVVVPASGDDERVTELELVGATNGSVQSGAAASPPAFARPPADDEDRPLFERDDFEQMLDPAVRGAKAVDEPPPPPPEPKPKEPTPAGTEGILILRSTATVLVVAVMVLMAVAFTAGFLVGSR